MRETTIDSFKRLQSHALLLRALRPSLQREASLGKVDAWLFDAVEAAFRFADLFAAESLGVDPSIDENVLADQLNHLTRGLPNPPGPGEEDDAYACAVRAMLNDYSSAND